MQDLLTGTLPAGMVTLGGAAELHRTGLIRILGVSSAERAPSLPDVPTFAEQGHRALTAEEWIGVLLPARVPPLLVAALHDAVAAAAATAEFRQGLARLECRPVVEAPGAFAARLRADQACWAPIVRASGFQPED